MFAAAAGACAVLTLIWIRIARAWKIEDQPGRRRLHALTTPRGGGIAIAIVFLVAIGWLIASGQGSREWLGLGIGVGLFAGLGLLDDLFAVPTSVKFGLQLLAATALVILSSTPGSLGWVAVAVLILACAYTVNVWNFMDGSNGLVATQALLIASALALWPGQSELMRLVAAALAGACAGFLPFNLPRARVFLGDVGSHALGAAVFGLLMLSVYHGSLGLAQALIIGSALLLDSGLTLARRALRGRRIWRAHREHLYQYAIRRGHPHALVCVLYGIWTLLMIALAAAENEFRSRTFVWFLFIFIGLLGTGIHSALRHRWLNPGKRRGR